MVFGLYGHSKKKSSPSEIEESYYSCHCACTMTVLAKIRLTWLRKLSYRAKISDFSLWNKFSGILFVTFINIITLRIRSSPYWAGKITLLVRPIMSENKGGWVQHSTPVRAVAKGISVGECGGVWGSVGECGEVWGSVGKCGEVWGSVWESGGKWGGHPQYQFSVGKSCLINRQIMPYRNCREHAHWPEKQPRTLEKISTLAYEDM